MENKLVEHSLWSRVSPDAKNAILPFLDCIPVKVAALARSLGLDVVVVALPPKISGEIRPSEKTNSGYIIRINRYEVKERQRFTIAHEIGHFLLHQDRIGSGLSDNVLYRSNLSERIEWEANRIAADLLMPKNTLVREIERIDSEINENIAIELAQKFSVSLPAMKIRLGIF